LARRRDLRRSGGHAEPTPAANGSRSERPGRAPPTNTNVARQWRRPRAMTTSGAARRAAAKHEGLRPALPKQATRVPQLRQRKRRPMGDAMLHLGMARQALRHEPPLRGCDRLRTTGLRYIRQRRHTSSRRWPPQERSSASKAGCPQSDPVWPMAAGVPRPTGLPPFRLPFPPPPTGPGGPRAALPVEPLMDRPVPLPPERRIVVPGMI